MQSMTNIRRSTARCPRLIALLAVLWLRGGAAGAVLLDGDMPPDRAAPGRCGSSPAFTMLNMTVTLDEAAPGQPGKVGGVDHLRIVYDANAADPKTKRVKLLNLQHFNGGEYSPPAPDPALMPTDDAWLDTSSLPYRLHYRASVVHGQPIIIEFDENSLRLTIRPQQNPAATLESGNCHIDPAPITGPQAAAAGGGHLPRRCEQSGDSVSTIPRAPIT